jgi:hypothetical protein
MVDRELRLMRRTLAVGLFAGLVFAVIVSSGILVERLAPGNLWIVTLANVIGATASLLVLAFTFRPFLTRFESLPPGPAAALLRRRALAMIVAQSLGAALGVLAVHLVLRSSALPARPWLSERPPQLVNDIVAVFGALALIWSCARRPFGVLAGLAALALALGYALTSSRWHLDAPPPSSVRDLATSLRSVSIQLGVLGQLACTAIATTTFRRLAVQRI